MKISALVSAVSAFVVTMAPFVPVPPPPVVPSAPYVVITVPRTTVPGMVTITQAPTPLNVGQWGHSAFPGMARTFDGSLRLVFREGSDHAAARDGRIVIASSYDDGMSWVNPQTIRVNPDYRDPSISVINGIEYLTWFGATATNNALGAGVMRYMNVESRRIDPVTHTMGAISAPVVKLPNGQLGAAFYGRKPGEGVDTSFMAWSSDSGWTWTTNRIVNAIGAGIPYNEPYLVVDGATTHFFYRDGWDGIGLRSSWNSGVTGTWNSPRRILSDATGRPSAVRAADGTLVIVYRQASTGAARIAYSTDQAQTWQDGGVLLASKGGLGMTYAAMVVDGSDLFGVVSMEEGNGAVSRLYGFRLAT